ncbi:hypothetical protein TMatcc_010309 [Talaromyces marneffei ATCC 18224]
MQPQSADGASRDPTKVRNLTYDQCYYHPAPLTRVHGQDVRTRSVRRQARIARREAALPSSRTAVSTPASSGFLGSTSYLSVFRETPRLSKAPDRSLCDEFEQWRTKLEYAAARVVRLASAIPFYLEQIRWYYDKGRFTVIPAPIVLDSLSQTVAHMESHPWNVTGNWASIYSDLMAATKSPLEISPNTSARQFNSLFTGPHLRFEFIGFIFAMAGLSVQGRFPGRQSLELGNGEKMDTDAFTTEMVLACHHCIEVCKQNSHVNDLTIWMRYMHILLATEVLGEPSERVYSLFGDLTSDIYAMGLHHQPSDHVPFFLAETRKRMLAVSHRTDKNLSTAMGRPPRLPHRYCDEALPLDLPDESLFEEKDSLERFLQRLDDGGWNRDGKFYPATLMRMRHILSNLREQVLELSLGRSTHPNYTKDILATYKFSQTIFNRIPSRYMYTSSCWKEMDAIECLARMIVRLEHLFSVLQLQRIRCQENSEATSDLLDTCLEVLSIVVDLTGQYNIHEIKKQFAWIYLLYGIPASGVLATELYRCTLSNQPLPLSKPRSEVIRTLSFLVSWVRNTVTEAQPSVMVGACLELNNVIFKLLDDALNYRPPLGSGQEDARLRSVDTGQSFEISIQGTRGDLPSDVFNIGLASGESLSWLDDLDFMQTSSGLSLM